MTGTLRPSFRSRPRALPGIEPDGKLIWTYFDALKPAKLPKSLLVMGSGAIGIEFASFYRSLGVEVTVVEVMKQVMPVEDNEIAKFAQKRLELVAFSLYFPVKRTNSSNVLECWYQTIPLPGRHSHLSIHVTPSLCLSGKPTASAKAL